ncbi:MAG: hypothetical protein CME70_06635 [Halobacteriovorax sp.]|nr:hypothetical protein [Halobacteriovorax sp.]|tara:strand:+ start:522903 stop:523097 length:195 start_codon:yes stop_codon:yes gene_type:complete
MKALFVLMLAILAMNVSYAGYGEDMKGECVKGKDSSRGQEVVASTQTDAPDAGKKESGSKTSKK